MTAKDFRRIALSFPHVEEGVHAGQPDFRVGGRKFAGLATIAQGYGNLPITPEMQEQFVAEAPDIFLPIPGGYGRMGHTHILLANADEAVLTGALRASYNLRVAKNAQIKKQWARKLK